MRRGLLQTFPSAAALASGQAGQSSNYQDTEMMTYRDEIELLRAAEELRQALSRQANDFLTAPQISNAGVAQAGELLIEIEGLDAEIHEYRISLWRQLGRPNMTEGTQR